MIDAIVRDKRGKATRAITYQSAAFRLGPRGEDHRRRLNVPSLYARMPSSVTVLLDGASRARWGRSGADEGTVFTGISAVCSRDCTLVFNVDRDWSFSFEEVLLLKTCSAT